MKEKMMTILFVIWLFVLASLFTDRIMTSWIAGKGMEI